MRSAVIIASYPAASDVAELVLAAEGVAYEVRRCYDDLDYGRLLAGLWTDGEGFVVVEHDVAPWPGAVDELAGCGSDWCVFRYAKNGTLTRGLGCTRFSDRLVREYPDLHVSWRGIPWNVLDGAVGTAVAGALREEDPGRKPNCFHGPPVAHARRPGD